MGYERDRYGRMVEVPDDMRCEKCQQRKRGVRMREVYGSLIPPKALCPDCYQRTKGSRPAAARPPPSQDCDCGRVGQMQCWLHAVVD
jgi:hypothetical protein